MKEDERQFIAEITPRIEIQLKELKTPLSWFLAHGRRRSQRQMREAREQREDQVRDFEIALRVFRSQEQAEVTFTRDSSGKILGFKIQRNDRTSS